jgi:hypothetical protein
LFRLPKHRRAICWAIWWVDVQPGKDDMINLDNS